MRRWIYAHRYVTGDPGAIERALLQDTAALFRQATDSPAERPAADGSTSLVLQSRIAGLALTKQVRVTTGVAHRAGSRVVLPITSHADPVRRGFPAFSGTLELETLDRRCTLLSLIGSAAPPLGPIGAVADATVLRDVARSTADAVVRRLADVLAASAGAPAASAPATSAPGAPLTVADVMSTDPLVLDEDLRLRTAALMLFHADVSGAPVVDAAGRLVGVLTEADLLAKEAVAEPGFSHAAVEEERRRTSQTAGEACSRPARTTVPGALLGEVARRMLDEGVRRYVVVDGGGIAGIVSRHDVLRALIRAEVDIELAVLAAVRAHGGDGVAVSVAHGEVSLSGTVGLRSAAARMSEDARGVDGVMTVDAAGLRWEVDDLLPGFAML
jgi:CBS domain-containing protein